MSILLSKNIKVDGTKFPITYTVVPVSKACVLEDGIDVNTCLEVVNPTGTLNNSQTVKIEIQVFEETCLECWDFNFIAVDPTGCTNQVTFSLDEGPCGDFDVTAIQHNGFLKFYVGASAGSVPYSYQWTWNAPNMQAFGGSDKTANLQLQFIPGEEYIPGQEIDLTVIVTDDLGCEITVSTTFPLCQPTAQNITGQTYCRSDGSYFSQVIIPTFIECSDCEIQLNQDSVVVEGLAATKYSINTSGYITFDNLESTDFNAGLLVVSYYVIDECGRQSTTGSIVLQQGICGIGDNDCDLYIPLHICEIIDCSAPDDCFTIDVDDYIVGPTPECETNEIDWSTLALIDGPIAPATVTLDAGNHAFEYCPNGTTENVDYFKFEVYDTDGNYSGEVLVTIALAACPSGPVLGNDTFEVCEDSSDNELDVLANDTPPYVASTLMIVSGPDHGTAFVSNGKIYYTPTPNYNGADEIVYKVASPNGVFSEATVTITVTPEGDAGGNNTINFA